jgi:hypothetical protein
LHKIKAILLALALVGATSIPAMGGVDEIDIFVDLAQIHSDVPPIIENDRTMVPVRAISEAIGCAVDWYGEEKRVIVYAPSSDQPLLIMTIGDPSATLNSFHPDGTPSGIRVETLDSPPVICDGRTMVPLRFIAETLGFEVAWEPTSKTVSLYSAQYLLNSKRLNFDSSNLDEIIAGCAYMLDNSVLLQTDVYPPAGNGSEDVLSQLKKAEGDLNVIEISASKELSGKLLYPAWIIYYDIGVNRCLDAYVQTEYEDFRLHSIAPREYFSEYEDDLMKLLLSVELVRNIPAEQGS